MAGVARSRDDSAAVRGGPPSDAHETVAGVVVPCRRVRPPGRPGRYAVSATRIRASPVSGMAETPAAQVVKGEASVLCG
ncbi:MULTISPECIES: hypothetical protein [Streptomyces]|uniref:Uncharacterized protein n=2 Tax=Streptomyces TaxID=1883 RepID=A0ABV9IZB0_9ACTN